MEASSERDPNSMTNQKETLKWTVFWSLLVGYFTRLHSEMKTTFEEVIFSQWVEWMTKAQLVDDLNAPFLIRRTTGYDYPNVFDVVEGNAPFYEEVS